MDVYEAIDRKPENDWQGLLYSASYSSDVIIPISQMKKTRPRKDNLTRVTMTTKGRDLNSNPNPYEP